MFYYLDGTVAEILPYLAVIDCGGVGYACKTVSYTHLYIIFCHNSQKTENSRKFLAKSGKFNYIRTSKVLRQPLHKSACPRIGCGEVRRIEHENIDEAAHGPAAHAAPPASAGAVLPGRRPFGTGPVGPGAGHHGGRAAAVSGGLRPPEMCIRDRSGAFRRAASGPRRSS